MERMIKVGYVVMLKSGGPQMTITAITNNYATVSWFDENVRRVTLLLLEIIKAVEADRK
jgi:uncharacterized protein YodC (DUF2158 family)